ncbi:MAG: sensor histidine kinase, partial [Janthinobacterium lividum]
LNARALAEDRTVARTITAGDDTILLAACPLDGPLDGVTGWTQSRVRAETGLASLQSGLIALLVLLVLISILLGRTLLVWGRQIRSIEATLGRDPDPGHTDPDLPPLPRSGERELDRIVDALNLAGSRLAQARRAADAMAARAAQSERLAALGRVAAGVAHEIRNPLAAARLQGENALAGDDRRRQAGIADMLEQLDRLDALVSELLAMTQRVDPAPTSVALPAFLAATAARHADTAAARSLTMSTTTTAETAYLDPAIVTRILDNLLSNAIRHAAPDGVVALAAHATPGLLTITVSDDGAGIPADMADRLFEPFVTSRADGTGLGLAIARELADAHGGNLVLREMAGLTTFALELPQDPA